MGQTHDGLLPAPWLRLVLSIKFGGQHEAIAKSRQLISSLKQNLPHLPGSWDNRNIDLTVSQALAL